MDFPDFSFFHFFFIFFHFIFIFFSFFFIFFSFFQDPTNHQNPPKMKKNEKMRKSQISGPAEKSLFWTLQIAVLSRETLKKRSRFGDFGQIHFFIFFIFFSFFFIFLTSCKVRFHFFSFFFIFWTFRKTRFHFFFIFFSFSGLFAKLVFIFFIFFSFSRLFAEIPHQKENPGSASHLPVPFLESRNVQECKFEKSQSYPNSTRNHPNPLG